jgi:hypothetical protein
MTGKPKFPGLIVNLTIAIVLSVSLLFGLRILVVYADDVYFDWCMFKVVNDILCAHPAVNYNVRRSGKRKLATLFFLEQWQQLVINPRTDIELHFTWMKRYFVLTYFQSYTLICVTQFVFLTYIADLAVALATERYQRPELHRSRSMVLVNL